MMISSMIYFHYYVLTDSFYLPTYSDCNKRSIALTSSSVNSSFVSSAGSDPSSDDSSTGESLSTVSVRLEICPCKSSRKLDSSSAVLNEILFSCSSVFFSSSIYFHHLQY